MRRVRIPQSGRRRALPPGQMNQVEKSYSSYLALNPIVIDWRFETLKLRLANKTFFTPDFFVLLMDGSLEVHEVKGHWEDDARVKIKVAAAQFPWFRFRGVSRKKAQWVYEDFS